jgi:hypothetical protein
MADPAPAPVPATPLPSPSRRPWRIAIWLVPVVLFLLNLFNHGFSQDELRSQMKGSPLEDNAIHRLEPKTDEVIDLQFSDLQRASYTETLQEQLEGCTGRLRGQFVPGEDGREGTLVRFRMVCCAADVVPLRAQVIAPASITHVEPEQWVQVTGQLQFRKLRGRDEVVPVLQVRSPADIVPIEPEPQPFLR